MNILRRTGAAIVVFSFLALGLPPMAAPADLGPLNVDHEEGPHTDDERRISVEQEALLGYYGALPDPEAWSQDAASGLYYRRTTAEEHQLNEWRTSSFLVQARDMSAAGTGASNVQLLVPIGDTAIPVTFTLESSHETTFHSTHVTHLGAPPANPVPHDGNEAVTMDVFVYETEATSDALPGKPTGTLRTTAAGGLFARVFVSHLSAEVLGPEDWWHVSDVPAPDGGAVEGPLALVMVSPSLPPLSAPAIPGGDVGIFTVTTYKSATMGEMQWCTRNISNWKTLIDQTASEIDAGFSNNGGTDADIARKHDHCWTANTLSDAQWCNDTGPCYDSSSHLYPYSGAGTSSSDYLDNAWSDISHSRQHWTFDQLKLTQTVYDGEDVLFSGLTSICGEARTRTMSAAGATVAMSVPQPTGCHHYVDTHETGHNFDATHDQTVYGSCTSVMGSSTTGSCRDNYFSSTSASEVDDCVAISSCPRSGTG